MMTLEEVWENLRQDPEIKATMEEAEKSYKLFKKIENLIVADLEAKLKESEKKAKAYSKEIIFLDKKLENLNKEFELAQEHNEKTVEYWQNKYSQLKQRCKECKHLNKKIELNIKNKLVNEIQQLKQQLAEKDAEVQSWKDGTMVVKLGKLEEQLAKKDKEIEELRFRERNINGLIEQLPNQNQTAIAELEKAKEFVTKKNQHKLELREQGNLTEYGEGSVLMCEILLDKLDQQIKSLKGEK